ncbi:sodium channel protein Nach isoform X2 [Bradysia coprophila]|nr:sodium channel protein Nach isoform X2 [Bradysia coprophila]
MDAIQEHEGSSISMVVESLRPLDQTDFVSVALCEMGHTKQSYKNLDTIMKQIQVSDNDDDYSYDVEDFLLRIIFHNLYNFGSIVSYCQPYVDCTTECTKCPENNYEQFAMKVRANCTELVTQCAWNDQVFDCCKYFQPLKTTLGTCFLINSRQLTPKDGPNWLNTKMDLRTGPGSMRLEFSKAVSLFIINEEDIPHMLLTTLQFNQQHEGTEVEILLSLQNVINDKGVQAIDRNTRKCIFPSEQFKSSYKYYSYSTCVTECLKDAQLKVCNCTHHNMIYDKNDLTPVCDYNGLVCLDNADLIFPQTTIMQPWRTNGLVCSCLPSCSEHEVKMVGKYQRPIPEMTRKAVITLQDLPTQRYRRQAVKDDLDIVVSVGGILSLFLGASILSGVEFIYFFTIRLIGTSWMKRRNQRWE